jgi:hypothetical protein
VNNSGGINILDATVLIANLYKGVSVLYPSACDVNADCTANILDVTYLMAFMYEGGSAPLAGCIDLYPYDGMRWGPAHDEAISMSTSNSPLAFDNPKYRSVREISTYSISR